MPRRLPFRVNRELQAAVEALNTRMSRLEGHQQRFQDDTMMHLRRADAVNEDLVAALDVLRRRIEALEAADRT